MYSAFLACGNPKESEDIRAVINNLGLSLAGETTYGESAIYMVRDLCPDILIVDMNLAFINGLALAELVHKAFPWIKIILLSGSDDPAHRQKAAALDIAEYLMKPVRPYELRESLQRVVNQISETHRTLGERIRIADRVMAPARLEDEWELGYWLETGMRKTNRPWFPGCRYARVLLLTGVTGEAELIAQGILRMLENDWQEQRRVNALHLPWGPALIVTEDSEDVLENLAYGVAYTALCAVRRYASESVFVRIGPMVDSMEGLRDSWAKLKTYPQTHAIMSELDLDCAETAARAKDYIDTHYDKTGLLLLQAAQEAGTTVNRLCVLFEQHMGVSLTEYLFRLRISRAQTLLAETRMRVNAIAQNVGFLNPADFASLFRHRIGQTPLEYRRACQNRSIAENE